MEICTVPRHRLIKLMQRTLFIGVCISDMTVCLMVVASKLRS